VETLHHPVGSCRMGRPGDPEAVADGQGRLFSVEALHIIGASLIPRGPSANTHLAVIALAERLSAVFQEAYRLRRQATANLPSVHRT